MSIAFDTAVLGGNNGGSTTSLTWSHTVGTPDPYLFVGFEGDGTLDDVSSVTYNSVALSLVGKSNAGSDRYYYLYGLAGPTAGAHNVVVTVAAIHYVIGVSASYTGAPGGLGTSLTATGAQPLATSITPTVNNSWTVLLASHSTGNTITAGTGSVLRMTSSFNACGLLDSGASIYPAASYSMTVNDGAATGNFGVVMAVLAPGPRGKRLSLLGVS